MTAGRSEVPPPEQAPGGEAGFSIVEMVVAMTLLAVAMVAFAQMMYGGMSALQATRQRSVFLELATAEMESLRAVAYDKTCVTSVPPDVPAAAHPVTGAGCLVQPVSNVATTSEASAHKVSRLVTWTNTAGEDVPEANATFKRLTVQLDWMENNKTPRTIRLSSVRYPGGFGPTGKAAGPNKPPVIVASAIPQFGANPGQPIVFDASGSTDDGGPGNLTYSWDFKDGDVRTGAIVPNKAFAATGTYEVVLTVTDSGGLKSDRPIQVTVVADVPGNLPPVAAVTATCHGSSTASDTCDPFAAVAPLSLTFSAQGSTDPEDDNLYFIWDWDDGSPLEAGPTPVRSHVFAAARNYNVKVTAIDPFGKRSTATVSVLARPLNCAITSGSLFNGVRSTEQNHIRVKGNGQAHTSTIQFTATSNTACTNLKVRLPIANGTGFLVFDNLSSMSDGATVTWTATRTMPNNTTFHLLANQTVEFIPAQTTGAFPGTFTVSRENTP